MATIYCRSTDGNDGDSGATWALAKATLEAAITAAGAGGTVYVSDNHAQVTAGGVTMPVVGTAASPVRILCVDDSAEPPTALATTATFTTTGASASIFFRGFCYIYGITFSAGDNPTGNCNIGNNDAGLTICESCVLHCASGAASTGSGLSWGLTDANTASANAVLIGTTIRFSHVDQRFKLNGSKLDWRGGSVSASGSSPTILFEMGSSNGIGKPSHFNVVGVDLSHLNSGESLTGTATGQPVIYRITDCKLGASVAISSGTPTQQEGVLVEVVNCDSGDTNTRFARTNFHATETSETTIVRTGGASDGTTTFSRKVVTGADTEVYSPYVSQWWERWNETTGSAITLTVETVTDNVTLTDAEAWLEVEYLGTSGFPLGSFANDRIVDPFFGTPANQTSSSETWGGSLGTPIEQKLAVTVTPQEKGVIRYRVCVAKASTTVYYDPKAELS